MAWFLEGALLYVSQASGAIFPLLISPFIVRAFGLHVFGEYVILLTIAQLSSVITEFSFNAVGPRLLQSSLVVSDSRVSRTVFISVFTNKLALIPVAVALSVGLEVIMLRRMPTLIDLAAVLFMIFGLCAQASWHLIATYQARLLAVSNIVGRTLSAVLVILMIVTKYASPSLLFLASTSGIAIAGLISLWKNRDQVMVVELAWPQTALIRPATAAFYGVAASALQNILGQTLVSLFTGTVSAGRFAAVDRISRAISSGLKPVFMILYPRMAVLHATCPRRASRIIEYSFVAWLIFSMTAMTCAYLFGERILILLYGPSMVGAGELFEIVIGWLCIGILNNIAGIQGLLAAGHDREYSVGMWIGISVTLACSGVLIPLINDIIAVALSVFVGELVVSVFFLHRYLSLSRSRFAE